MAQRTKYTLKRINTILEVIRRTGVEKRGCKAAGVAVSTYQRWKVERQELRELVEGALEEYDRNRKEAVLSLIRAGEDLSLKRFFEQLKGTRKKTQRVTEKVIR